MSDLLSPILYIMENEVDAFWCFVAFMDQMVSPFTAVSQQLARLSLLCYYYEVGHLNRKSWGYI